MANLSNSYLFLLYDEHFRSLKLSLSQNTVWLKTAPDN